MKNLSAIILILLYCLTAQIAVSQTANKPALEIEGKQTFTEVFDHAHQYILKENPKRDTSILNTKIAKISYKFILEYGLSTGIDRYHYRFEYSEEKGIKYSWFGVSLTMINNIALNDKFLWGIGGGLELRMLYIAFPSEVGGTCFFNFRYYFKDPTKTFRPLINISSGVRIVREIDIFASKEERFLDILSGAYCSFSAGFKAKRFSFHAGLLFLTKGSEMYTFEAVTKIGLNF